MTELSLLIEPETLENHLSDSGLLIVELSDPERYAQGHIPGAVHVHPGETQRGTPPAPGLLPTADRLQQLVEQIGLNPGDHVVVYDDEGGGWAGRFIWLLDCIGHHRYSYLNGGRRAWENEGHPMTTELPEPVKGQFQVSVQSAPTATMDEVAAAIGYPDTVIWDARSPEEYHGQRQGAARNGHIPGAVNLEWTRLMDTSRNLRLHDEATLRQMLSEAGIAQDSRVITHCQTHHRSGLTYLVAKLLGHPQVQGYAGSWSEWGNQPDTPVDAP